MAKYDYVTQMIASRNKDRDELAKFCTDVMLDRPSWADLAKVIDKLGELVKCDNHILEEVEVVLKEINK